LGTVTIPKQVLEKRSLKSWLKDTLTGEIGLRNDSTDTFLKKLLKWVRPHARVVTSGHTLIKEGPKEFSTSVELLWKSAGNPTGSGGFR